MNIIALFHSIITFFIHLNLFESIETRLNAHYLRTTIIATRIYIVLITAAVLAVIFFTAFNQQTYIITVHNPSEDVFRELYTKYPAALQCPCKQVEIPYKTFVNISYTFHPICSSVFVSKNWINLLFRYDMGYYYPFDFRSAAPGHFQLLASLCLFANRILQDAIDDTLSSTLLSSQTLSLTSLETQGGTKSDFLRNSTIFAFRRLLQIVRDTTQMNGLQPAMQTSKIHLMSIYTDETIDGSALETIWPGNGDDSECFCGITSNCFSSVGFFDLYAEETEGVFIPPIDPSALVIGLKVGCYALDGLFSSTLECFYDISCLSTLLAYFPISNITSFNVLDMNQTRYSPEETIEVMINDLFLEQWSRHISFSSYYSVCAPLSCVYKVAKRASFLQILTTLLGLYGGLTLALRIVVLQTVRFWRNYRQQQQTQLETAITLSERFQNLQIHIKNRLIKLNLFKTHTARTDPYQEKTELLSTRVYLLFLILALGIILVYLSTSVQVLTGIIEKPSRTAFENLYEKYTTVLRCPCSHIANEYTLFTSISPVFHPVCSSLYISDQWIVSISSLNNVDALYDAIDFRTAGPTFFNALTTLCLLTNTTIADAWYVFSRIPLITDLILTELEFQTRTKQAIMEFQENTIREFNRMIALVELHSNTMYATGYTNFILFPSQSSTSTIQIDFELVSDPLKNCSCNLDNDCIDVMSFFTYTDETIFAPYYLNYTLSDIFIGCYVLPSTQKSSLSCFFNQTCLDSVQVEMKWNRSIDIPILEKNNTRFEPNSHIGKILENMMIEKWNEKMNYNEYFKQCAPEQCVYTYTTSANFLYIVTTIFGLFGGLSVALRTLVPIIIRFVRNKIRTHEESNTAIVQSSNRARIIMLWHTIKAQLSSLNMFKTELSWDDDSRRRKEILTTRFYILLLIVCNVILVIYTVIETQTQVIKILRPSQDEFEQFRLKTSSSATLDCPCQNITIPYQSFISVQPHFHQLCSSDFTGSNLTWLTQLKSSTAGIHYAYNDYRHFVVPQFQLLTSLCTLANDTVTGSIQEFSRNVLITERVQFRETIQSQANTNLNRFRRSTPRTFVRNLDFILSMAQGNGILSYILSNWHLISSDMKFEYATIWPLPYSYGDENCSCALDSTCTMNASMDGFVIPGFRIGCYPLESLLQSTLECLYNITCIDQIKSIGNRINHQLTPLDASLSNPMVTVQTLIDNLLIERWETNVSYEQYYTTCAPLSCTYTFTGKISLIYTITTIIGLQGGLSISLKLFVPAMITIGYGIFSYRYRHTIQVVPVMITTSESIGT